MNEELGFKMVQAQIGYSFKNLDLLRQAFTRRSFSEENGGENNEILEFIGDKALDLAVIRLLSDKFGKMKSFGRAYEFSCEYSEGELTQLKSRIVEKKNLAARIDELGFAELLRMGGGDVKNNVSAEKSVKEDLFEAIIGAVTIDSGWHLPTILSVTEAMLVLEDFLENDEDDNYVRLIQEWEEEVNHVIPWFRFKEQAYTTSWYLPFDGISQQFSNVADAVNFSRLKYTCELKLLDGLPIFRSFGASKSEARMNVCKLAYEYLEANGYIPHMTMRDEISEPTEADAINQLEILARRGYFSIPTYEFEETYDADGNPVWSCRCAIEEYEKTWAARASSKKKVKKLCALKMLEYILSEDDKHGEP